MKLITIAFFITAFTISCNNSSESHSGHDTTGNKQTSTKETETIQQVKPAFVNLEGAVASHIKEIFDHYIHVKTALVNSNTAEAKNVQMPFCRFWESLINLRCLQSKSLLTTKASAA